MREFKNTEDFKNVIKNTNLLVLFFTASWCGPCKQMYPFVEKLSESLNMCKFYKIDVDEFEHLTEEAGISCMPTFQFYKNNQLVEKMEGADGVRLENLVIQHM